VKFAAQIFITKSQHKNCRLARRYVGKKIKAKTLRLHRKSKAKILQD
jgi:hypothetical protein